MEASQGAAGCLRGCTCNRLPRPLDRVNEVTPQMLPERVVADCLELGITPANIDSVLHSTARCLGLDREFTNEVFSDVQIYNMNRRKREWLLPYLRLDSPLEYGEQWYSWYCTLKTMHLGGLNAVDGSKSFVSLVCEVWGEIHRAIQRISTST